MAWTVSITPEAQRQLQRLDRAVTERIGKFIDQRLVGIEKPQSIGHALTGDHRGRWTTESEIIGSSVNFETKNWSWSSSR